MLRRYTWSTWLFVCLSLVFHVFLVFHVSCKNHATPPVSPTFDVPNIGLRLPKLPGWRRDDTLVASSDLTQGGTALRLLRESSVFGSPRVEVHVQARQEYPTDIDAFLAKNLGEMGLLEEQKKIHIVNVSQATVSVGQQKAYRVRHTYTLGEGSRQVAINQVSTFFVVDGRGVSVTTAGRTELFHPIATSIEAIHSGLQLGQRFQNTEKGRKKPVASPPGTQQTRRQTPGPASLPKSLVEPIDLGRIGGE